MATTGASALRCHHCPHGAVDPVPGFEGFRRVTSDCKPWHRGGTLAVCRCCGLVQKPPDPVWRDEVEHIYAAYTIYHQSGGHEQAVFDRSGFPATRSSRLVDRLGRYLQLPGTGRLLDVGCGNGAFLREFNRMRPGWALAGVEVGERYRSVVERIRGVDAFHVCALEEIPGRYELITLIHVLEHIPGPGGVLASLAGRLTHDGLVLIQTPNFAVDPFDLLIADHCAHFSADTLVAVVEGAGYDVLVAADDWVPKQVTILARRASASHRIRRRASAAASVRRAAASLAWLRGVADAARKRSGGGNLGLFGTSIAATWLFAELEGEVGFFADEDPGRIGRTHLARRVYHPRDLPPEAELFVVLPTAMADAVQRRLSRTYPGVRHHVVGPGGMA